MSLLDQTHHWCSVKLESDSVIGAGSVITKNVKKKSLAISRSNQLEIKNYKRKQKK